MKTTKYLALALIFALQTMACLDDRKPEKVEELPAAAQEIIKTHFADKQVKYLETEREGANVEHDITFDDGTRIDFDKQGQWVEISGKVIPESIIPAGITTYVKNNYPDERVVKIERETGGFDVDLSNKLEMHFSDAGEFIRIDD